MRRLLALCGCAGAALCAGAPAAQALSLQIVNQSGKPDAQVYVTLAGSAYDASFFTNNQPVALSSVPTVNGRHQVTVNTIRSGRLYVAYGQGVNVSVPFDSKTRFDWTEFTVFPSSTDVANMTRVDMFGIPMRLDTVNASGSVLQTLSEANADKVFSALKAIPGGSKAVVNDATGHIARILSPNKSSVYPDLSAYVKSMSGQAVTLKGRFFGSTQAVWNYSGKFGADGSITLAGSTKPPGQAPAIIPVSGAQLIRDIYTGGNTPNNAQGAIYRDLLAGFATGLWGGKYGNDDIGFCTNPATDPLGTWCPTGFNKPAFGDARTRQAPYAACEQYAAVINQLSDAYGNPYSDAAKPVLISLNQPGTGGKVTALRLTILPDTGSSGPVQGGNPNCGAASGGSLGGSEPSSDSSSSDSSGGTTSGGTASGGSGDATSVPGVAAVPPAPGVAAALPRGRALIDALDIPRSVVVGDPKAIVIGSAICPPACDVVRSRATVGGAAAARRGRAVLVGRDGTGVANGQTRDLTLALTWRGRRLLEEHGRLRTKLSVTVLGTEARTTLHLRRGHR